MKTIVNRFYILMLIATGLSCADDLEECPSKMCVMAGSWKLTQVYADNALESGDLSQYRLVLHFPSPADATTSTFDRVQVSGAMDSGDWSIQNNGTVLRLMPNNNIQFTEDWIIDTFSPRELVLTLNRDVTFKEGPATIKFVLEPF